jgi:hypothetical protein
MKATIVNPKIEASYPKAMRERVKLIAFNRDESSINYYGSNSLKSQYNASDVDLIQKVTEHGSKKEAAEHLAKGLQQIVHRVNSAKLCYCGEWKAGTDARYDIQVGEVLYSKAKSALIVTDYDPSTIRSELDKLHASEKLSAKQVGYLKTLVKPHITAAQHLVLQEKIRHLKTIRWTPRNITDGFTLLHDGTEVSLVDALKDDLYGLTKVDIITVVNSLITEMSNTYEIHLVGTKRVEEANDSGKAVKAVVGSSHYYDGLKKQVLKYCESPDDLNVMKASKRIFTIAKMTSDYKTCTTLLKLFNSGVGIMYASTAILKSILYLLEHYRAKLPWSIILENLDIVKGKLSMVHEFSFNELAVDKEIDMLTALPKSDKSAVTMEESLDKLTSRFKALMNTQAKDYLAANLQWPPVKYYPTT